MTLYCNLYGGPGTGKSTTAAGVFHYLKLAGVNAEIVTEYAKDLVWGDNTATLRNQLYVFGKQHNRMFRLDGKVDVVVTDSPILLSLVYYDGDNNHFEKMVIHEYNKMNNMDVFLKRVKKFNPAGRLQDEKAATQLDDVIKRLLQITNGLPFHEMDADNYAAEEIAKLVVTHLKVSPDQN